MESQLRQLVLVCQWFLKGSNRYREDAKVGGPCIRCSQVETP